LAGEISMENIKEKKNEIKHNKFIIVFAILYTLITIWWLIDFKSSSGGRGFVYVFIFPIFWLFAGILLAMFFYLKKVQLNTNIDMISLIFSTPIPLFYYLIILSFF